MDDVLDDVGSWLTLGLAVAALFGNRLAYLLFVAIGILFMPVKAVIEGFSPTPCEMSPSLSLMLRSFQNYNHIVMFAIFTVMTRAQFAHSDKMRLLKVAAIVLAMGVVVELEQGLTGRGHCRIRDLLPDATGFCMATVAAAGWDRLRRHWSRPSNPHPA